MNSVLTKGGHHPLLCDLVDDAGIESEWIVKPEWVVSASNRRGVVSALSELVGAEVCTWFDVPTPEASIVQFPPKGEAGRIASVFASVNTATPELCSEVEQVLRMNADRVTFACRRVRGADIDPGLVGQKRDALAQHARVISLDAWMRNNDRQVQNPNLIVDQRQYVAIDHGDALQGIETRGQDGRSLANQTVASQAFTHHIFCDVLDGQLDDGIWEQIVSDVRMVTEAQVERLCASLPKELDYDASTGQYNLIGRMLNFLKRRIENTAGVIDGLRSVLRRSHADASNKH